MDGRTDGWTDGQMDDGHGRRVITTAHPKPLAQVS